MTDLWVASPSITLPSLWDPRTPYLPTYPTYLPPLPPYLPPLTGSHDKSVTLGRTLTTPDGLEIQKQKQEGV